MVWRAVCIWYCSTLATEGPGRAPQLWRGKSKRVLVFAEGVVQMHGSNNLTERKVAKFEIGRGSSTGRGAPALICSVLVSKAGSDRVLLQKLRETERNAAVIAPQMRMGVMGYKNQYLRSSLRSSFS